MIALMPHVVTLERVTARDKYNAASARATVATPRAYVAPKKRRIVKSDGTEALSRGSAICEGVLDLTADAEITVPSSFTSFPARMPVLSASPFTDPLSRGLDCTEVLF